MIAARPPLTSCDVLEWDSRFFGRTVARYRASRCSGGDMPALAAECAARAIECVYILVSAADTESLVTLARGGAFFADVRVTFGAQMTGHGGGASSSSRLHTRPAVRSDVPALRRLAAVSHRDTRFHADPHFPADRCDRLYETWIEASCEGDADCVLVADGGTSGPIGYATCHDDSSGRGHIGLFAVAGAHQGRGVGAALLTAARAWFAGHGVTSMTVVTQGRNSRAVRFYERAGLSMTAAEFWFHYWPAYARARTQYGVEACLTAAARAASR